MKTVLAVFTLIIFALSNSVLSQTSNSRKTRKILNSKKTSKIRGKHTYTAASIKSKTSLIIEEGANVTINGNVNFPKKGHGSLKIKKGAKLTINGNVNFPWGDNSSSIYNEGNLIVKSFKKKIGKIVVNGGKLEITKPQVFNRGNLLIENEGELIIQKSFKINSPAVVRFKTGAKIDIIGRLIQKMVFTSDGTEVFKVHGGSSGFSGNYGNLELRDGIYTVNWSGLTVDNSFLLDTSATLKVNRENNISITEGVSGYVAIKGVLDFSNVTYFNANGGGVAITLSKPQTLTIPTKVASEEYKFVLIKHDSDPEEFEIKLLNAATNICVGLEEKGKLFGFKNTATFKSDLKIYPPAAALPINKVFSKNNCSTPFAASQISSDLDGDFIRFNDFHFGNVQNAFAFSVDPEIIINTTGLEVIDVLINGDEAVTGGIETIVPATPASGALGYVIITSEASTQRLPMDIKLTYDDQFFITKVEVKEDGNYKNLNPKAYEIEGSTITFIGAEKKAIQLPVELILEDGLVFRSSESNLNSLSFTGLSLFPASSLEIKNASGIVVFQTNEAESNVWNGYLNNDSSEDFQPEGTYLFQLTLQDDAGDSHAYNGQFILKN